MYRSIMALALLAGMAAMAQADYLVIRINLRPSATGPIGPNGQKMPVPPQPVAPPPKFVPLTDPTHQKASEYVQAIIEVKPGQMVVQDLKNRKVTTMEHKWGRIIDDRDPVLEHLQVGELYDSGEIRVQHIRARPPAKKGPPGKGEPKGEPEVILKTPLMLYAERMIKERDNPSGPDALLKFAQWCLEVGLPDKCQDVLNQIEKLAEAKDANVPADVARAVEAFKQIKPILTDPIVKKEKAEFWKQKLHYSAVAVKTHYALVNNSEDPARDGVDRLLNDLEGNFKAFYLAFAIKGKALPAPSEKLTAILIADMTVFRKLLQTFEVPERQTDGCHGRFENLVVFAPNRLDVASQRFEQQIKAINQSHSGIDLLRAQLRVLPKEPSEQLPQFKQDCRAHVFAMMDMALREESEMATATHEGSRQLVVETGLLPRNTAAPEWLRYGLASLFEMPKGPFPEKNENLINYAFWAAVDAPHWAWRRYLDEMIKDNLISDQPTDVLLNTLSGRWIERARELRAMPRPEPRPDAKDGKDVKEAKEEFDPQEAADLELARGRCLSWALTYYLFNERFPEFMAFLTELGNLPRDVELDDYIFLSTFCRSFGVSTTGLTPGNLRGNENAYADLSKAWIDSIRRYPAPAIRLKFEEPKPPDPKMNPNGPGR